MTRAGRARTTGKPTAGLASGVAAGHGGQANWPRRLRSPAVPIRLPDAGGKAADGCRRRLSRGRTRMLPRRDARLHLFLFGPD